MEEKKTKKQKIKEWLNKHKNAICGGAIFGTAWFLSYEYCLIRIQRGIDRIERGGFVQFGYTKNGEFIKTTQEECTKSFKEFYKIK